MFVQLDAPHCDLPAHSQVKAVNLQHFPALVARFGGNHQAILERHGFDPSVASDENRFLDCQPFVDMLEFCATSFNDALFGYHLAQLQEADVYGLVAAFCRAAPDMRSGIQGLINYLPVVHSTESLLELAEAGHTSELRWSERTSMGDNAQASYQGLLLNLKVLQTMAGQGFAPAYIHLPREGFRFSAGALERSLGCPVRLSTGKACIAFSSHWLNHRVQTANQPLFRLLIGYLEQLRQSQPGDLTEQVKGCISQALASGQVSIDACAAALDRSVRSLQIHLKSQGTSFSSLLEQQRIEAAKRALKNSRLPISEIADALGYAERTSFGRAFKRWTGMAPQQFRTGLV